MYTRSGCVVVVVNIYVRVDNNTRQQKENVVICDDGALLIKMMMSRWWCTTLLPLLLLPIDGTLSSSPFVVQSFLRFFFRPIDEARVGFRVQAEIEDPRGERGGDEIRRFPAFSDAFLSLFRRRFPEQDPVSPRLCSLREVPSFFRVRSVMIPMKPMKPRERFGRIIQRRLLKTEKKRQQRRRRRRHSFSINAIERDERLFLACKNRKGSLLLPLLDWVHLWYSKHTDTNPKLRL